MGLGKLLGKGIKLVALPFTLAESGLDIMSGGDGSNSSKDGLAPFTELSNGLAKAIEETLDD